MKNEHFEARLFAKSAPDAPGVYIFRDGRGRPLYIGKAKRLSDRLSSYRQKALPQKTMAMLAAAKSLDWIVLKSEFEALLCEAAMVRQYMPRYNIDLRDDKRYPMILLTDEPFPKALKVRKPRRGQGRHFGPFPGLTCNNLLEILSRRFRIRRCPGPLPRRERACIDHDIGRCDAPCIRAITREGYQALVEDAARFLSGNIRDLVGEFETEMKQAALDREFEKAAALRDEIAAMKDILARQDADRPTRGDADALAVAAAENVAVVVIVSRRKGAVNDCAQYVFDLPLETPAVEIARRAVLAHYADRTPPPVLCLPAALAVAAVDLDPRQVHPGARVALKAPQRGDERAFQAIAEANAGEALRLVTADRSTTERNRALVELVDLLALARTPRTIEGYDNSTFAGKDTVAAGVRFADGLPRKSEYRLYRIRGRQDSDVDAMAEVMARRAKYPESLPDLILIDGGMGQLLAARDALASALAATAPDVVLPPLVGLEKREELIRTLEGEIIRLPRTSPALKLLQQVRDEAHRFGKSYHAKLRGKRAGL